MTNKYYKRLIEITKGVDTLCILPLSMIVYLLDSSMLSEEKLDELCDMLIELIKNGMTAGGAYKRGYNDALAEVTKLLEGKECTP